ncbi:GntR family transcriptional regulator [Nocardiopsis sp. CNT312]|uniref:GntR family transcriptional regulator n=1 Tax=Nocardiopsis sp. CNT312 TaxID=1137268 RepID=UPI00048F717E|nr:GntR family transcriptional regulator [Nocardiopsis sp. CNT312]
MPADSRRPRSEAVYEQVARNIRNGIEAGVLRHGQALPSTRQLAEEWKVSVHTISEAMRLLIEDGLVISKSRSQRVIHAPNQTARGGIRLRTPNVLLIGGYAGSGKSELGRVLARETGWPMLDKDTLTRPVVEAALEVLGTSPHDRESDTYLTLIRPREYEALAAATRENVECGTSVITAAPYIREFTDPAWIDRTKATYEGLGAKLTFVWVNCDAESMHTYIRHRGAARDAAKLADWQGYLNGIDVDFRPSTDHVVVENSTSAPPLQNQADDLVKKLMVESS